MTNPPCRWQTVLWRVGAGVRRFRRILGVSGEENTSIPVQRRFATVVGIQLKEEGGRSSGGHEDGSN